MGDHGGPARGFAPTGKQTDSRKPFAHIITGLVTLIATIALSHVAHVGQTGPAGPAGAPGKSATNPGICAYFGPNSHGLTRFQVSTPNSDGTCSKGVFVKVAP